MSGIMRYTDIFRPDDKGNISIDGLDMLSGNSLVKYTVTELGVKAEDGSYSIPERYIPDKAAIGRTRYLQFIEDAVTIFGENKIRSSLVVGLEPAEDTLEGVKDLVNCGCLPVLSAFVPAPGTDMANYPAPEVSFLFDLVKRADEIAKASGMVLGPLCRPCTHNSITIEEGIIDLERTDFQ